MTEIMKIFITGACGKCGTALVALPYEKIFYDRINCVNELLEEHFIQGDLSDINVLAKAMQGCDAVIHLAASTSPKSAWEEVLHNNIIGTQNILKIACHLRVDRIIFASSNHVVGMYEMDNAPHIYEIGHKIVVDRNVPIRPDSFYGVSKAFGESLGCYFAENGGPKFLVIRIGAVRGAEDDHPYAYAEEGVKNGLWDCDSEPYQLQEKRLKAIWQSRRDFIQMIDLCLKYNESNFDIFYGVSDNPRRWLDIEHAKSVLGYQPQDNAEYWRSSSKIVE